MILKHFISSAYSCTVVLECIALGAIFILTRRLLSVHSGHFRGGCLGGGGGDWFLNNVCIYDNKQWAVGVLSDLCWNLRVFCPVGSLGTCKKVLGVRWRKRGVYQQVLNLRKGVGHPFVEPQLGVGDDGVLTGNFSQKAGIAISNSSHVPGAPPPPR